MKRALALQGNGGWRAGLLVCLFAVLFTGFCAGAESVPLVEVTAPEAPVRLGRRFTVTATVSWEGEGKAIDIGRPGYEVPEGLRIEGSSQESRTVLEDGALRSLKKYDLVLVAEKEGKVLFGPITFSAKREGSEFGLTGKAVEIEVVGGQVVMWWGAVTAIFVILVIFVLIYRKQKTENRRQRTEDRRRKIKK